MKQRAEKENGFTLIIVLWVGLLLGVLAFGLIEHSGAGKRYAIATEDIAKARAMAEAGVNRAVLALLDNSPTTHWPANRAPHVVTLPNGDVTVTIESEAGKVDLNDAPFDLLQTLFSIAEADADRSAALAAAVIDWRDQDDLVHLNGAESPQYRSANLPYGAKNEPFDSVDELRKVLGVTPDIFAKVAPALTVYTHQRSIDPTVLAPLLSGNVPEWSQQGPRKAKAGMVAPSAASPLLGRAYTIRATAKTHKGNAFVRNATIRITANQGRPYQVLAWRQGQ